MNRFDRATIRRMCIVRLREVLCPTNVSLLTRDAAGDGDDLRRLIEWVREDMVYGRDGTGYVGKPWCFGFLKEWSQKRVNSLFNADACGGIMIPLSGRLVAEADHEMSMRAKWMIDKNPAVPKSIRKMRRRIGLIVQSHVSDWFRRRFPSQYQNPDNYGIWHRWCAHDFKLALPHRTVKVDVTGRRLRGDFGRIAMKPQTDIYVLAELHDENVEMIGATTVLGSQCNEFLDCSPIRSFIVWVNCEILGFPYVLIRDLHGEPNAV